MTQNKSPESIEKSIIKQVFPYWGIFLLLGCMIGLTLKNMIIVQSAILGSVFSLLALRQLADDQYSILIKRQRRRVFISFILRLVIFSIPIIVSLKFENYFKIWITLLFLFSSHMIFIISELIINYNHYKQRMKNDG